MPSWLDEQTLNALIGVAGVVVGATIAGVVADLDSRRDAHVGAAVAASQEVQAKADQAASLADLSQRVMDLLEKVSSLDTRVQRLETENGQLRIKLEASFRLIRDLIEWVARGCHGAIPRAHESIAGDVDLHDLDHIQLSEN